jgi:cytochrome oxidase Cu insertion factor (SCO1/SenC/PrrC family)
MAVSAIAAAPPATILRCKIFPKAREAKWDKLVVRAFNFDSVSDICMKINDKAPDFTLPDENGKEVSLKDFRGKTVILFFFPRASTPG